MARASHARLGVHNTWPLAENAERLSMSFPVTSFTVTVHYSIAESVYIRTVPLVQSVR